MKAKFGFVGMKSMKRKLGDVCLFFAGTGFPVAYQGKNEGELPFFKVGDIANNVAIGNTYLSLCNNYISFDEAREIRGSIIPKGTVVFAKIGEALKLNRRAITSKDCLIDNNAMGIAPKKEFLKEKYFYYFMKQLKMQDLAESTTVPSVRKSKLEQVEIVVPSIEKQKEIERILDKVSQIIYMRKQELQKLDDLIKARFVELFGDPIANPFGWRKLTVQQAIDEKIIDKPLDGNHGGKHPKTSDYVPSGIPFIMANNLVEGKVDLENCAFISRKQADSLDKGFAKDGDVLITHKGTIGRTAILHCSYPYIMLTPQVTYYRPKTGIIPEYLKAYFDTDYFQGIIGNIASVGSTRAYIGITAQQELPLIVPPMELQKQFAAFVEQTDKSKVAVQKALDEAQLLFDSLMQKYFG